MKPDGRDPAAPPPEPETANCDDHAADDPADRLDRWAGEDGDGQLEDHPAAGTDRQTGNDRDDQTDGHPADGTERQTHDGPADGTDRLVGDDQDRQANGAVAPDDDWWVGDDRDPWADDHLRDGTERQADIHRVDGTEHQAGDDPADGTDRLVGEDRKADNRAVDSGDDWWVGDDIVEGEDGDRDGDGRNGDGGDGSGGVVARDRHDGGHDGPLSQLWQVADEIDRRGRAGDGRDGEGARGGDGGGSPDGLRPAVAPTGGFWDLAKKGIAAWGREPSVDEMVEYWRGLIDDVRSEEHDSPTGAPGPMGGDHEDHEDLPAGRPVVEASDDEDPTEEMVVPGAIEDYEIAEPASSDEDSTVEEVPEAIGIAEPDLVVGDDEDDSDEDVTVEEVPEADAVDLEDTIELDELAALAGLGSMAELTELAEASGVSIRTSTAGLVQSFSAALRGPGPTGSEADAAPLPDDGPTRPVGLAGGGLAFAGCLGLMERRRRAQQRHRPRGRQIVLPAAPLDAYERELRHGADREAASLVDVAVRAAAAGRRPEGLPPIRWVEASAEQVTLVLATAEPAPPGFAAVDETRWVTSADVEELAELAAPALPPLPALVPLGTTDDGHEVLVDLEAKGVVTVAGRPDDVVGLLRAAAVTLATAAWCEPSTLVVVGLDRELATLPGIRVVDDLGAALALADAHPSSADDCLVVVSAVAPESADTRRRLAELARWRGHGVGLLVAHPTEADELDSDRIEIDTTGRLRFGGLTTGSDTPVSLSESPDQPDGSPLARVWARRLDEVEIAALTALVDVARHRDGHGGDLGRGLDARRPTLVGSAPTERGGPGFGLESVLADVDVVVRVLGDVDVVRLHGHAEERVQEPDPAALELIAHLALTASPTSYGSLQMNLCMEGAESAGALDEALTAARDLLGEELLPAAQRGRYALSGRVVTDYGILCALVTQAEASADPVVVSELLTDALDLVRDVPLGGTAPGFAWAGPRREAMVARIVDVAERLAEHHLDHDDPHAAEQAARRGLKVLPCEERLYRLLMRSAHAAGGVTRVHEVFAELCDVVADPDHGVEPEDTLLPETVEILERLATPRRPHHDGSRSDETTDSPAGSHLAA